MYARNRKYMDTLGIEPRAYLMLSGCDTTTPCAPLAIGFMYQCSVRRVGNARAPAGCHVMPAGVNKAGKSTVERREAGDFFFLGMHLRAEIFFPAEISGVLIIPHIS